MAKRKRFKATDKMIVWLEDHRWGETLATMVAFKEAFSLNNQDAADAIEDWSKRKRLK